MYRRSAVDMSDLENGEEKAKAGTALFLIEVENKRAMKVRNSYSNCHFKITCFLVLGIKIQIISSFREPPTCLSIVIQ